MKETKRVHTPTRLRLAGSPVSGGCGALSIGDDVRDCCVLCAAIAPSSEGTVTLACAFTRNLGVESSVSCLPLVGEMELAPLSCSDRPRPRLGGESSSPHALVGLPWPRLCVGVWVINPEALCP